MTKNLIILLLIFAGTYAIYWATEDTPNNKLAVLQQEFQQKHVASVDHSKLAVLQQDFDDPRMVTAACISCHTERHTEIMKTPHWNWEREEYIEGRGIVTIGKKNNINNFCIGIAGSEALCNKCHAGYGWDGKDFDFQDSLNVDCLVCHDNSGTYEKANNMAGLPKESVDLGLVARHVGIPMKENCGSCHFMSGGGNNVKHGDLEMALLNTTKDVDVHMAADGMDMECVACHTADNHQIKGKMYSVSSMDKDRMECESCHSEQPHSESIINEHSVKVACQTCHIPEYAKVNATKMHWDWSAACKTMDPNYHESDSLGNHVYLAKKGRFVWQKNVTPEYTWFNGTADHYLMGDKIDTTQQPIDINTLNGSYADRNSKIIPVKIHRTRQAYDPVHLTLIQPKLWDADSGNGALWVDCKTIPIKDMWGIASEKGMEYIGLPYSGQYDFINTRMYWPINHMVSPKENALDCKSCHTREGGRLEDLKDFYMPGRDYNGFVQTAGVTAIILSLLAALGHAFGRIFVSFKKNQK
jgi:octaheme c-type cytochrome (tetrathionate reductase family)